jgi:uncharacterized protein (DUF427 family)
MDSIQKEKESVWDYPRPPVIKPCKATIEVIFNGVLIAQTTSAKRVLETSHPPVYFIPPEDVTTDCLFRRVRDNYCPYKGCAKFYDIVVKGIKKEYAAYTYPNPWDGYSKIKEHFVFYAHKMDECKVNGERVTPQPGEFFGGWITSNIMGPYKGLPGTQNW